MPWRDLPEPEDWQREAARRARKARIYADADIEDEVVEWLRAQKVNIKSARELGHQTKPDAWQAAYALRERRFLLTKNGKDFLSDRKLPWHKLFGLVVVEGDMSNMDDFALAMTHVVRWIVPMGELHEKTKILVHPRGATIRYQSLDGSVETRKFRFERGHFAEWVSENTPDS